MTNDQDDHLSAEHDPYARRPGYVTGVDGRTDRTTTAMVAGVVAAAAGLAVAGALQVAEWIDHAIAEANGGRRFFVATNPVVVMVMGAIFIVVAVAPLVFGSVSAGRLVIAVIVGIAGIVVIVQGAGTLIVRGRAGAAPPPPDSGSEGRPER
jgi:hypothetical protein